MGERAGFTVPIVRAMLWSAIAAAYSASALLKPFPPFRYVPDIPLGLDAALSFIMAVLIAFRVNRAYERWWEARTLWGKLVNVSRNLAVKVRELPAVTESDCRAVRDLIVDFCTTLRDHLRGKPPASLQTAMPAGESKRRHVPSQVVQRLYGQFSRWQHESRLSAEQLWILDAEARWLLEVCGACERIKTTLMPVSWRRVTTKAIVVYLLILPWGLVEQFRWWTVPLTAVTAYFVITAEIIARHVEEPFGKNEDHLHLDRICRTIDESVSEILRDDADP